MGDATPISDNAPEDGTSTSVSDSTPGPTNAMVQQMESRMAIAPYTTADSLLVGLPLICAIRPGLLLAIFTAILGARRDCRSSFRCGAKPAFLHIC